MESFPSRLFFVLTFDRRSKVKVLSSTTFDLGSKVTGVCAGYLEVRGRRPESLAR